MQTLYSLLNYLSYLTPIVLVLSIVLGVVLFKQLAIHYRILLVYFILAFTTDGLLRYFGYVSKRQYNLFVVPFFALGELLVLGYLYYRVFFNKSLLMLGLLMGFVGVLLIDALFFSHLFDPKQFQTYSKLITNIGIVTFCLVFYGQELKLETPRTELITLNAAMVLYFSVNLVIFSSLNFYVNAPIYLVFSFAALNILSAVAFYLFIDYQIWKHGKTPKTLRYG